MRSALTAQVRQAARIWDIEIHSAFVGLAGYTYNGLLHPDPAGRRIALEWWHNAIDVAADIGARAVGGPLGGMSVQDAKQPTQTEKRYQKLLESVETICRIAADAGLQEFLVEPTPLKREVPYTTDQAQSFLDDLGERTAIPVRYVIDVGHALYQPLYGPTASVGEWMRPLGDHVGLIHLQNTDFQSDSHWGWPDDRGEFDVADFAGSLRAADLNDIPVFLEVFYPFELADEEALSNIKSSVLHCSRQLNQ